MSGTQGRETDPGDVDARGTAPDQRYRRQRRWWSRVYGAAIRALVPRRAQKASVYTIPTSTIGTLSSEISMAFRFHGASHVVSTGCTSSTDALFYACDAVIHGSADIAITGGVDAPLAPGILAGFCLMRILTESWNDRPEMGSRPFSKDRDGFVLGEGAW